MELFDAKGCLSEEGLQALVGGQLDETQRLEAAEHLAYCDRCMDRWRESLNAANEQDAKRVYYLSMEFLTGRALTNALLSVGIYDDAKTACTQLGADFDAADFDHQAVWDATAEWIEMRLRARRPVAVRVRIGTSRSRK